MSEITGVFSEVEEEAIAKFFDGLVDCVAIMGGKTVSLKHLAGKILEKLDRSIFKQMLEYVDNSIIANKVSDSTIEILKKIKEYILNEDVEGFNNYLTPILVEKLNLLSSDELEEQLIKNVLATVVNLENLGLQNATDEFASATAAADVQDGDAETSDNTDDQTSDEQGAEDTDVADDSTADSEETEEEISDDDTESSDSDDENKESEDTVE